MLSERTDGVSWRDQQTCCSCLRCRSRSLAVWQFYVCIRWLSASSRARAADLAAPLVACALLGLDADGLWANKTTFGSMLETFGLQDDAKPSTISSNMSPSEQFEQLFSYGSLQDKSVQLRTFDRTLAGTPDVLTGYRAVKIEIRDRTVAVASGAEYYLNAQFVGDASECVAGTRFDVTKQELERADVYEASANYRRVRVQLKSGVQSWIYVSAALAER